MKAMVSSHDAKAAQPGNTGRAASMAPTRSAGTVRIGSAGDRCEHEAGVVANHVLDPQRAPGPQISAVPARFPSCGETAPPSVTQVLASPGEPLAAPLRRDMERRFGHDFSQVRIHADAAGAASARDVQARAWTVGRHIAFGGGRYAPQTLAGQRLVAHELAHVVQQSGAAARADAAFGTAAGQPNAVVEGESKTLYVPGSENEPVLQRELEGDAPAVETAPPPSAGGETSEAAPADRAVEPAQSPPPATATPTLTLGPAAILTRGDTLTATLAFTPAAGETMNVVAWRYTTPNHGNVTRASTEPDFQTRWSGAMALSGTLEVDYTVTPRGGTASAVRTLTQAVTVNDRSGAPWTASADLRAENGFAGRPNPPQVFSDLGIHNVTITNPAATATAVAAGPNTGFSFVGSLTAGTYVSQPSIHSALTNATSRFNTFHQDPSRLYLRVGTTRTLIPLTAYSGLSTAGGTLTFTVPDWEAFYKARRFYDVTATGASGAGPVTLRDAWWGLASNAATASLAIRDAAAIRAALGIPATEGFSLSATARGSWEGFQLMPSAAILTGTRSHEYVHARHSHRANFTAMLRAVDPQRKIEQTVSTPTSTVDFATKIANWVAEILKPNHELVDEAASRTAEAFAAASGSGMAGVNTDPATGNFLGSVWNITGDDQMV